MNGLKRLLAHSLVSGVVLGLFVLSGSSLTAKVKPTNPILTVNTNRLSVPIGFSQISRPDALFEGLDYITTDDQTGCALNNGIWLEDRCKYYGFPVPVEVCFGDDCLFHGFFYKIVQLNLPGGNSYGFSVVEAGLINNAKRTAVIQLGGLENKAKNTMMQVAIGPNYNETVAGIQLSAIFNSSKEGATGVEMAGLLNSAKKVRGAQVSGLMNVTSEMKGLQLGGLGNGGGDVQGMQLTAGMNGSDTIKGVQVSGLANFVEEEVSGLQMSGIANFVKIDHSGIQISGAVNYVDGKASGVQLSLGGNYARHKTAGVQAGLISNRTGHLRGVQVGLINTAKFSMVGGQIGLVNRVGKFGANDGAQLGFFNGGETDCMVQLGVINSCNGRARLQLGLINMAEENWIPITILVNFNFN